MATILDQLAAHARTRVEQAERRLPLAHVRQRALRAPKAQHRFHAALAKPGLSFICELKKASPSKGVISPDFPYLQLLERYEEGGADAVSCLTEPRWFLGSDEVFSDVRGHTALPLIRKDFTVDEYQLYEAHLMGADAVLLVCGLLDSRTIAGYLEICDELGLDALVETHDAAQIESAVEAGARLIGVNNRDLTTFDVDFSNAERLRGLVPEGALFVAESGVRNIDDIARLAAMGADAALVGEALMRSDDPARFLKDARAAARIACAKEARR